MELENLKEAWVALDNRLKRNEKLNESIILEMMRSNAGKKVNRIIALEMISVAVLILLLPFIIYSLYRFGGGKLFLWDIFMKFMAVVCFLYPFWGVYKLHGLMKIDITKNIGNNILCLNKYNIQIKNERKFVYFFLVPVIAISGVCIYTAAKATLPLWTFFTCAFCLAGLFSYWSYKKYNKSFESVIKSLEEIRELREE